MPKKFSRRLFVGGVAAAVGGVAANANTAQPSAPSTLSVEARIRWCNYRRAIASVRADMPGASDRIIHLQRYRDGVDGGVLRKLLRPDAAVTLDLSWKPELDPLSPWRVEAVVSGGRRLLAVQGRADDQDDMHIVIAVAAEHFGVAQADILSNRRARQMVRARLMAMYLAHAVAGYAVAQIASAFERDYTSVSYAIRKLEHAIDADPAAAGAVSVMRERIHELAQTSAAAA